jgi:hypothetical protein
MARQIAELAAACNHPVRDRQPGDPHDDDT